MIKILSGWSNPGGSTTSWINLTNELNRVGYPTCLYGPHNYHIDKCKSNFLACLKINNEDRIIIHFLKPQTIICKKYIFSSHEQNIFPISNINYKICDKIHYVSQWQKEYHNIDHPYFIIPNIVENLKISNKPDKIFGIIGSIDRNKNVHKSIERAINDGAKKILIYGMVTDQKYFMEEIQPIIKKYGNIEMKGFCNDKQKMYDSISRVYQDSEMESWGYIRAECIKTGTEFYGNKTTEKIDIWNTDKIIEGWLKEMEIL